MLPPSGGPTANQRTGMPILVTMEDHSHDAPSTPSTPPAATAPAPVASTMQVVPFSLARILEYGRRVHAASTVTTYRGMNSEQCTFAALGSRPPPSPIP